MKKFFAVILAGVSFFACFSAGCNQIANDENTIEIYAFSGGYGVEFIEEIGDKFEEVYPEYRVELKSDSLLGKADAMLKAGPNNTTTDLFFTNDSVFEWVASGDRVLKGYDVVLEDLTDIYESESDVEGFTVGEKMYSGFEKEFLYEEYVDGEEISEYYSMPWSYGLTGLIYNETKFFAAGITEAPRTTEELFEDADILIKNGQVPFVTSVETGYDVYLFNTWWAQYQTAEGCQRFWEGVNDYGEPSVEIFAQKGRLYALQACEQMLSPEFGRSHELINSLNYSSAQAQLYSGNACMIVCGDWYENEMYNALGGFSDDTLKMMRTPVISQIREKTPSITSDEILREVVSYIDGDRESLPAGVTEPDAETIRVARNTVYSLGVNLSAFIPVYATAKEGAKLLLKFMTTDEALRLYMETTNGNTLPYRYSMSEAEQAALSDFQESKHAIVTDELIYITNKNKYPLCYFGGLTEFSGDRSNIDVLLAIKEDSRRLTGEEMYLREISAHTESSFRNMLVRAGLA